MLSGEELRLLHTNQRLVVLEMQRRGIDVVILDRAMELLEASYGSHRELMLDRDTSIVPYASSVIAGDKALAKWLLSREAICVPEGMDFTQKEMGEAIGFAQRIGFPVVAKPTFGSHGDAVYMDLRTPEEVEAAIKGIADFCGPRQRYLIEEQFEGKEHRVFVTANGDCAVLHRDPASVLGDGFHTISELAVIETDRRMNPRTNCLCPIAVDDITRKFLEETGYSLETVPKAGQKIYTSHSSNVARGGMAEDFTGRVHPSVIAIARQALAVFTGLPYAGIDFLTKDSTIEQTPETYRILEVNTNPGVHMHMMPGLGQPRDVARYMVDIIYPETASDRRRLDYSEG